MGSTVGRLLILVCGGLLVLALIVANAPDTEFSLSVGGTMERLIALLFTPLPSSPAAETCPETHWVGILFLIIIPSMFGGLLAVLQIVAHLTGLGSDDKDATEIFTDYKELSRKKPLKLWYIIGVLAGLGGGLTVLIILALDGKFDQPPEDKDRLLFIGTGLISGYLGLRLVRKLSNQFLKEKTDALDEKANAIAQALDEKAKDLDAKAKAVSEKTDRISDAVVRNIVKTAGDIGFVVANTLADPDTRKQMPTSGITDAIQRLNEAIKLDATNRRNILFLARILRHQRKDVEGLLMGIKTLDHGIVERRRRFSESQLQVMDDINEATRTQADDTAALYYNRSCYWAMIYGMRKSDTDREASLDDFEMSLRLHPLNVLEIEGDRDFDSIRNEARFLEACRIAQARLAAMPDGGPTTAQEAVAAAAAPNESDSVASGLTVASGSADSDSAEEDSAGDGSDVSKPAEVEAPEDETDADHDKPDA